MCGHSLLRHAVPCWLGQPSWAPEAVGPVLLYSEFILCCRDAAVTHVYSVWQAEQQAERPQYSIRYKGAPVL